MLQRALAMIANLGCELAQIGIAAPSDIDLAMKLAQNYPRGPLEWAEWLGLAKVQQIMCQLQAINPEDAGQHGNQLPRFVTEKVIRQP